MVISHIISAQREMSKTGDPVEKGSHTIHDVGLIEFAGAVAAAVENVVFGVHTVLGQQLVKPLALRDGNQWVGAAVDDEKRRRAAHDNKLQPGLDKILRNVLSGLYTQSFHLQESQPDAGRGDKDVFCKAERP